MQTMNFEDLLLKYEKIREYLIKTHQIEMKYAYSPAAIVLKPTKIKPLAQQLFSSNSIEDDNASLLLTYALLYVAIETIAELKGFSYMNTIKDIIQHNFAMSKANTFDENIATLLYANNVLVDYSINKNIHLMRADDHHKIRSTQLHHCQRGVIIVQPKIDAIDVNYVPCESCLNEALHIGIPTSKFDLRPTNITEQDTYLNWLSNNNHQQLVTYIFDYIKEDTLDISNLDVNEINNIITILERLTPEIPNIRSTILSGYTLGVSTELVKQSLLKYNQTQDICSIPNLSLEGFQYV